MDIRYIIINRLFGRFNHEIKISDGVNIIIGDNGVGKTVCLKIINNIFNGDFGYLFELEFQQIIISFGKEIWSITKCIESEDAIIVDDNGDVVLSQTVLHVDSNLKGLHEIKYADIHLDIPPYYEKISENEWVDRRRGFVIEETELLNRLGINKHTNKLPEWITKRINGISVRLIDTQRIYRNEGRSPEIGRTISKYVKDISVIIRHEQNRAGLIASRLDRTFPTRLVRELSENDKTTPAETLNSLSEVDNLTHDLSLVGLTTYEKDTILKNLSHIDDAILKVLSLYASDMKEKLNAYNDIQNKLQLFLDIINSRFKNKKCILNRNQEFEFAAIDEEGRIRRAKTIAPTKLSSGEQNEFVLFYDLVFNCDKKNLILVDEPELSLHIKWQQMMIGDLLRICEHNHLNIFIATHSPDLIGNHWSLVQKLE